MKRKKKNDRQSSDKDTARVIFMFISPLYPNQNFVYGFDSQRIYKVFRFKLNTPLSSFALF